MLGPVEHSARWTFWASGAATLVLVAGCAPDSYAPVPPKLCPAVFERGAPAIGALPRGLASLDLSSLMEIGDLDGDMQSEIVVLDPVGDAVSVVRLTPTDSGLFAAETTSYAVGRYPLAVAIGDVDGDGCKDIVAANFKDDEISVLTCPASGGAEQERRVQVGAGPRAVEVVDIDGDGAVEIVVAGALDGSLTAISLAKDDPRVWDPLCSPPGTTAIVAIPKATFADIWLMNTERSTLSAVVADGMATFTTGAVTATVPSPAQYILFDHDLDATEGLAVRGLFGDVMIHTRTAGGELGERSILSGPSPSLSILPFALDGREPQRLLDLTARHGLVSFESDGAPIQRSAQPVFAGASLHHLLAIDVEAGVGIEQVVGRVDDSYDMLLLRASVPAVDLGQAEALPFVEPPVQPLIAADFNGDGIDDLLVIDPIQGVAAVMLGGLVADLLTLPDDVAGKAAIFAVGYFDLDQYRDLAFISAEDNAIITLKGGGDGRFTTAAQVDVPESAFYLAAGDVSGDGVDDLVLTAASPIVDQRVVYLGDGQMSFVGEKTVLPGAGGHPWVLDVDEEGLLDIVFYRPSPSPHLDVIVSAADAFLTRASLTIGQPVGGQPLALDIDRDGNLDLIVCGESSFEKPAGLLVFRGGEGGDFGGLRSIGIAAVEFPGAPPDAVMTSFECDGLFVRSSPAATSVTAYGVVQYGPEDRFAAAFTFVGEAGREAPASFVRGELLRNIPANEEMHGDFTGDGVIDLVGRADDDSLVLLQGRPSVAFASLATVSLLPSLQDRQ